jgi:raffinose/stachyose/melibiose transport system permease protein
MALKKMRNNIISRLDKKVVIMGLIFMLPGAIVILWTSVIPLIWNIVLSFQEWNGNSPVKFVGFDNFIDAFSNRRTGKGFLNSFFIGMVSTAVGMFLGMFLALCVYKLSSKESAFCRFIYFSPSMLPTTVIGLLFIFVLAPDGGLVNAFLELIGLGSWQTAWVSNRKTVLWVLAILQGWRSCGTIMMLFYTGMIRIPPSFFEASRLEGSNYFHEIKMIILPLLRPTFTLSLSMMLLSSFRTYDLVWTMTKGGPGDISMTAPISIIESGFHFNKFGSAAAQGVILTVLVSICLILGRFVTRGENYEY